MCLTRSMLRAEMKPESLLLVRVQDGSLDYWLFLRRLLLNLIKVDIFHAYPLTNLSEVGLGEMSKNIITIFFFHIIQYRYLSQY